MKPLQICIVEDDPLTAESISIHLEKMGHHICGNYSSFDSVFFRPPSQMPDLYLIDIRLRGDKTGVDIAKKLQQEGQTPFLFVTSNTEYETIRKAMQTAPLGYITKPFSYEDLLIGIELVKAKITSPKKKDLKIPLKTGQNIEMLSLQQILYLEADRSYVNIHLEKGIRVLRKPLKNFLEEASHTDIIRVHRSYAVNPHKIECISNGKVIIYGHKIPLAASYRKPLFKLIGHINSLSD